MKSKKLKHEEGEERNAEWRKLSRNEKLNSLMGRRGLSKKQTSKLLETKE